MKTKNCSMVEELIIIDSVQNYIEHVLKQSQICEELIFRGHSSISWDLKPGIGRKKYSPELERKVFELFKKQYYSYIAERPNSDLEILFLAQHYGLPTRLLDWTYNPMIALYFACEKFANEIDGCIYTVPLHNFYMIDKPLTLDQIMSIKKPFYVVPKYTDARYRNQKALFLLCSSPQRKFTVIKKTYMIPKECKEQIIHDLALLGYDKTLVFPLLDSLCDDIKKLCNLDDK